MVVSMKQNPKEIKHIKYNRKPSEKKPDNQGERDKDYSFPANNFGEVESPFNPMKDKITSLRQQSWTRNGGILYKSGKKEEME